MTKRKRLFSHRLPSAEAQAKQDVDGELGFHIDKLTEALMREGMDADSARAAALQRFGDLANARSSLREQSVARERRIRRAEWFGDLLQDIRYAIRTLARKPVFTIAAVLTLALAIGANTAMFGVAHGILFEPLPYAAPERLVMLWQDNTLEGDRRYPFSPANYRDLIERNKTLDRVAAYAPQSEVTVVIDGVAGRARAAMMSTEFLDVVGVRPLLGQNFTAESGATGSPRVAMISDGYWRRQFAADPSVIGRAISSFGTPLTIVGVLPARFTVPTMDEVDIVEAIKYSPEFWQVRARHSMRLIARLRDGVTVEQARDEANSVFAQLEELHPNTNRGMRVTLLDVRSALVGDVRSMVLMLLGAVLIVLLVACANIANLLLVQASERSGEFNLRTALGAARSRIVRQLFTESGVLAVFGVMLGIGVAYAMTIGVRTFGAASLPLLNRVDLSTPVFLFALGVTTIAAILVGVLPAFRIGKESASGLREGARGSSATRTQNRTRRALVVAQVALSVILLAGASLLLRSYRAIMSVDPGFETERVLTFSVMKMGTEAERLRFFTELERDVLGIPGVRAVGSVSSLPMTGPGGRAEAHVEGHSWGSSKAPELRFRSVTRGYFAAMGLRILQGRDFSEGDVGSESLPLLLNREAARRVFADRDPIGQRIRLGPDSTARFRTVIGVVEDTRNAGLTANPEPEAFLSHSHVVSPMMTVTLRAAVDPTGLVPQVRAVVTRLDPTIYVADVRTTRELVDASVAKPRFVMMLLTGFAILALLLAMIGTYAVLAYSVNQRRQEIGVRMALGADRESILRLIVGEGGRLAAVGVVVGTAVALFATRALKGMLFAVEATDPLAFAVTITLIAATTLFATLIPALRASRFSSGVVLRGE